MMLATVMMMLATMIVMTIEVYDVADGVLVMTKYDDVMMVMMM